MPTVGLCMIVKDEAALIERCLDSVRRVVQYVLIVDTGSRDGTQDIIRRYLARHRIQGEVVEEPWRDFAYNRTFALAELRKREEVDYALIIDADDRLVLEDGFDAERFRADLHADLYDVLIRYGDTSYHRPQIFRNRLGFHFKAVQHEYLEGPPGELTRATAAGLYIAASTKARAGGTPANIWMMRRCWNARC
jgi:glycosyltransferase involved in cell wall biosynthesis